MKTSQSIAIILIAGLLTDCQRNNQDDPQTIICQPPTTLVAKAPCESGYPGVLLISSDYQSSSYTQFEYDIYVQKDTLSNDLTTSSYKNASNERIIISETVLKDAPKFAVRVTIHCDAGNESPSRYFSFIKRPTASPGCYAWAPQKQ